MSSPHELLQRYIVFNDNTLLQLALRRPQRLDELREIHGIGEVKILRYSYVLLEMLKEFDEVV